MAAPDVAINVFKRGGRIDLQGHNGDWGSQARALYKIKELNADVARKVACNNEPHLVKAANKLQRSDCEDGDIAKYLTVLQQLDKDLLLQTVQNVDPIQAEVSWNQRLRDRRVSSQRAIAILASVGSHLDGAIGDLSRAMLQRIPERVRDQVK